MSWHIIWTGYGHWLPNDPRGSASEHAVIDNIADLSPVHHGRKTDQPMRETLHDFYIRADERLRQPRIFFTSDQIEVISQAFQAAIGSRPYTCYACANLRNHAHLVIRAHRDRAEVMIAELQRVSRLVLWERGEIPFDHPAWTEHGRKAFLFTPEEIRGRITYVEKNPIKEGLGSQRWRFVTIDDGWPFHKTR